MKATLLLLSTLLLWAQALPSHYSNPNYIVAVLTSTAPSPFKMQTWHHTDLGLLLFPLPLPTNETALCPSAFSSLTQSPSFPAPLRLGDAASPAFDDNGDLYFIRSSSSSASESSEIRPDFEEEWYLPFRHRSPRPVPKGDEGIPEPVLNRRRLASKPAVSEPATRNAPYKITVDAGHGGSDPGAVAQGYRESDITLDISIKLRDLLLKDRGLWSVQMTRSSDVDVSLTARTNMANSWPADRFVSIHVNSFSSSSAQGTETYSYAEGGTAAKLRDTIQSEMIKAWGLVNRGSKTENFHVLRETTMPATLSETGFITSPVDIVKLRDPNARSQMAAAHLYALQKHFGVSKNLPLLEEEEK